MQGEEDPDGGQEAHQVRRVERQRRELQRNFTGNLVLVKSCVFSVNHWFPAAWWESDCLCRSTQGATTIEEASFSRDTETISISRSRS